jgi:hypothetical protein
VIEDFQLQVGRTVQTSAITLRAIEAGRAVSGNDSFQVPVALEY